MSGAFRGTGAARLAGATVRFEPGARSNWHSHPLGQLLVVTSGAGFVQAEGGPVREMRAGDVVWTAAGVKHWHGASDTLAVEHVAVSEGSGAQAVVWMEPVDNATYRGGIDQ